MGRWLMALLLVMLSSLATRAAEAYACYTPSNTTLTFYYDDLRSSRTGTTYDLNEGARQPDWVIDETNSQITQVVIDPSFVDARPTSTCAWFFCMEHVQSITGLNYLNTESVTNMGAMFMGSTGLMSLDLSHFNTTAARDMFNMFNECSNLTSLDVSSFNTAGVQDMRGMFRECRKLTSLDLSSFNTAMVEIMNQMFSGDTQLVTIHVGQDWSTESLNYSYEMFENCTSLVGGMGTTYDANHIDAEYAHIDGGPSNPGYFTGQPEAYACYTPGNKTLTFYYDTQRSSRPGTTYDLNEGNRIPAWHSIARSGTNVVFDPSFAGARPTSTYDWFGDMQYLSSISGMKEYLNTSEVTNMSEMFSNCIGLTSLDVSNFNTANVTNMNYMFYGCSAVTSLDVSNFNTANVTDMEYMFTYCKKVPSLDVSNFNTANVTHMDYMFNECYALTSLDLSSFNTANVTDMSTMFSDCYALTSLDLSSFNTANVTNMCYMFSGCTGLTNLNLSSFNTANVILMDHMFYRCSNLTTIDAGSEWSTAAVINSVDMFSGCTSLVGGMGTTYDASHVDATYAHIDGGSSNPGYFTGAPEAYACFTQENTTLTFYYDGQRSSRTGTTFDMNEGSNPPGWYTGGFNSRVTNVVFDPSFADVRPTTTHFWFYYMPSLTSITGLSYLNTSEVTDMSSMFYYCSSLTSLDLSSFNTSKVTDMSSMFFYCSSLTSIDLSSFNTSKVTDMTRMFQNCTRLTSLDLSSFNTSKVTSMFYMFYNCAVLASLDVSSFNTANVTDMSSMFLFCYALESLDLSSFNTANVTNMSNMFTNCNNLTTIYAGDGWNTDAVTTSSGMFANCTRLEGGMGTTYKLSNPTDKTYAHIDGGESNPGYFTDKTIEAYACYTTGNKTLTFYRDNLRSTRTGTTYDLNTGSNLPGWYIDGTNASVTKVVFDPLFVYAHPTTTYCWFYDMRNLTTVTGMNYLNTSEVTDMAGMFANCYTLSSLDLSHFNTSKVTRMSAMFDSCNKLTSLDLSSFNTANVTNMNDMFFACTQLKTIYVRLEWSTSAVTTSSEMFMNCTSIKGGMGTTYDANHIDATYARIDGGVSNPGYFTGLTEAYACYTPENTTLTFYRDSQRTFRPGTTYDLNEGNNNPGWYTDGTNANVTKVVFAPSFAYARPTTTYCWFASMKNLTSITGMSYLNTSEVTNMGSMFGGCESLTGLDVSSFNTANVTNMAGMFVNCDALTSLDLRSFNTSRVTDMEGMFASSYRLTDLDVSNFNTSRVTNMHQMFIGCDALTSLDLSSFNTANVTRMDEMFMDCSHLTTIYASNAWSTASVTSSGYMFFWCGNLVGGMGTAYDVYHMDADYAHIDGGPSNPGYFTAKNASLRGDVNADGNVTITDVTALINYLLNNDATGVNLTAADCNLDGGITITDVTFLINFLLSGSW